MEIINYFIAFIIGVFLTLIIFFIRAIIEDKKPKDKAHFYVARDMNDELWLYMGKPYRGHTEFCGNLDKSVIPLTSRNFKIYGLNPNDYDYLKWEDEPVEVFLNLED